MSSNTINQLLEEINAPSAIIKGERDGFLLSLMVLASYTILADHSVERDETEFVRNFLCQYFGEKQIKYEGLLRQLLTESKKHPTSEWKAKIKDCVTSVVAQTNTEERLLLLAFLIKISKADQKVDTQEIDAIAEVAEWLEVSEEAASRIETLKKESIPTWTI